jgi:hypothetical protein
MAEDRASHFWCATCGHDVMRDYIDRHDGHDLRLPEHQQQIEKVRRLLEEVRTGP